MLFCCHRYFKETEKRYLEDTLTRTHQLLEIGTCPKCNTKKVWYQYELNGAKKEVLAKGKKAEKLLQELQHQPYYELHDLKIGNGTKNKMFWLYQTNGTIKDFNNQVKGSCKTELFTINVNKDNISDALTMSAFY